MKIKVRCSKCNCKEEITALKFLRKNGTAIIRRNYSHGQKSKGTTTVEHRGCGGLFRRIK
jgi:hypothetical protein